MRNQGMEPTTDMSRAKIRLFDACEKAGMGKLARLSGKVLTVAGEELTDRIFANNHPITAMLFDLQTLGVVRIIEGQA